jgi:hypothetical protein
MGRHAYRGRTRSERILAIMTHWPLFAAGAVLPALAVAVFTALLRRVIIVILLTVISRGLTEETHPTPFPSLKHQRPLSDLRKSIIGE